MKMLKVNVGLSRKLSRDYNSTGFSVNLEGEITAAAGDSDAIIEQVKELFDLAEESLDQQVERTRSINAQASHDAEPERPGHNGQCRTGYAGNRHAANGHSSRTQHDDRPAEPATNKQIQYLLSIGKRQRLSTNQLEQQVQGILRREVGIYDLTKREAAQAIDALTGAVTNGKPAGRY